MSTTTNPQQPQDAQEAAQGAAAAQTGQTPSEGATAPQSGQEPDPVEQTDDVRELRSEAAKRRRALRETEAERDGLREQLDTVHRQEVQRLAADRLENPADLFMVTDLDQMRGEDGLISPELAEQAIEATLRDRPHWRKPTMPDLHAGARQTVEPRPTFADLFKKSLGR